VYLVIVSLIVTLYIILVQKKKQHVNTDLES
jgi:hypothetical protein